MTFGNLKVYLAQQLVYELLMSSVFLSSFILLTGDTSLIVSSCTNIGMFSFLLPPTRACCLVSSLYHAFASCDYWVLDSNQPSNSIICFTEPGSESHGDGNDEIKCHQLWCNYGYDQANLIACSSKHGFSWGTF